MATPLAMHDPMVIYLVWILTPVVPAYAMFKWLPSDASATGPFGGLKWKLGGAFAGYFLIVLISMNFVSDLKTAALAEQTRFKKRLKRRRRPSWASHGPSRASSRKPTDRRHAMRNLP